MPVGMITIRELLRDPQFKEYFTKVPQLPDHYAPEAQPWRLLVMKEGEHVWRAKRYGTYQEAFKGFKTMLPKLHDAAINCPPLSFRPPIRTGRVKGKFDAKGKPILKSIIWKPRLTPDMLQHHWCGYCRRPTLFGNKAMPPKMLNGMKMPISEVQFRCLVCGSSERIMDIRHPENNQGWDINRPRVFV